MKRFSFFVIFLLLPILSASRLQNRGSSISKQKLLVFVLIGTSLFFLLPDFASAHTWNLNTALVPCGTGGAECTRCQLFHLIKHLIDFGLLFVLPVVGTLIIIYAGVLYILSGANPGLQGRARSIFTNTMFAALVIILAWLITNTILINLGDNIATGWYDFQCSDAPPGIAVGPSVAGPQEVSAVCPLSGTDLCQGQSTSCSNSLCGQYSASAERYGAVQASIIKAILMNESSCNIGAQSPAGACGLMQLLPSTANMFRSVCGVNTMITCAWLRNPANADKSICIGTEFVRSLSAGVCGVEPENIAAGYNGGSTVCNPSMDCAGQTSCSGGPIRKWECLYDDPRQLTCNYGYNETRNYAGRVNYCSQNPAF